MWSTLHRNHDYFCWIKSLMTSSKIIPCLSEYIILNSFNLLCFMTEQIRCKPWAFGVMFVNSTDKFQKLRSWVSKTCLWTYRNDHEVKETRVLQKCIYIFGTQGEKNPTWNTSIVNLLHFHSNFLTSCGLLYNLWDFSRNILLFNK